MDPCKNIILIVALSLTHIGQLAAQSPGLNLDQIWIEQGLSQSTVYSIVQDAQGFMWFGTDDGLNRYDGYSITVFKHNPADSTSVTDNAILSLLSDRKGDLWIGTIRGGVDQYVPSENKFYHHRHSEEDSTTISDNIATCLFEDSNGEIWIGTNNGLNRYNRTTGRFTHFQFDAKDITSLSGNSVHAVCEDRDRNLWVATSQGLSKMRIDFSAQGFVRYRHSTSEPNSLSSDNLRSLCVDHLGTVWVGTWGAGLNRFDEKTNTFKHYIHNAKDAGSISGNFIISIREDTKGVLWIASYDAGLNMFEYQSGSFIRYIDDALLTLYKDRSGILWIGTLAKGVKMYDWRKNRFKHYYDIPNDLSVNIVFPILEDKEGKLWVGTYGSGLKLFSPPESGGDRQRKRIGTYVVDYKNPYSLSSNRVTSLCESTDGGIWVGTDGGGLNCFDKKTGKFVRYKNNPKNLNSISSDQISTLCYDDQKGFLYIGYNVGGFDIFNGAANTFTHYRPNEKNPNGLAGTAVTVIYKGKRSGLWIGTFRGIVHRFIPESNPESGRGSFKRYLLTSEPNRSVNNNAVFSIYEDDEGIVWMGTYGGGLSRFDPATPEGTGNSFKYFTEQNGLSNNVIYGILPDKRGHLWLSTNKGISRFDTKTMTFRNYDVKDGLQGNEFNQGAYFASPSGEMFFGGVNGFNAFFPSEIEDNGYIPPVYVTSFKVFDKTLQLPSSLTTTKQIELSYSQNFFSFEFVALNYTSPERNQYSYKLEGFDEDWHKVSASHRYTSYTNIDPGEYILRVKGSNNDGVWNETGTSITLIVTPPFWMTWWFRSLLSLIVVSSTLMTGRFYTAWKLKRRLALLERQHMIDQERTRISQDMHDTIGSSLTRIAILSDRAAQEAQHQQTAVDEPTALQSQMNLIGATAREVIDTMNEIIWSLSQKHDSLESLVAYIRHFAKSMFETTNIEYKFSPPDAIPDISLSPDFRRNTYLIVKEAVNNVVKHSDASSVSIAVLLTDGKFEFELFDNGVGFSEPIPEDANGMGFGLKNMRARAKAIGATLEIESFPQCGTKVRFSAPLRPISTVDS